MLVALTPTYGRRPELIENCLACLETQTIDCRLLMLDDLGNIAPQKSDRWEIVSVPKRLPTITSKYSVLARLALERWPELTHFAIWDDDDSYAPTHLEKALTAIHRDGRSWSYPRTIISSYFDPPKEEPTDGRFWATIVFTRELLERVGGFVQTRAATFDQQFLSRLAAAERPAIPDGPPTYLYRWQSTHSHHASGFMTEENGNNWYDRCVPQFNQRINKLTPRLDDETKWFQRETAVTASMISEKSSSGATREST